MVHAFQPFHTFGIKIVRNGQGIPIFLHSSSLTAYSTIKL
jgi:hypothetical protein